MITGSAEVTVEGKITYVPDTAQIIAVSRELFEECVDNKLAIQRVRELHKPWKYESGELSDICSHCHDELYPCPTIKVLDGDL